MQYNGFLIDGKIIMIAYFLSAEQASKVNEVYEPIISEIVNQYTFEKIGEETFNSDDFNAYVAQQEQISQ